MKRLDIEELNVDPRDRGLLPLAKARTEETKETERCEHFNLFFTDGQFRVTCFDCSQVWMAIRNRLDGIEIAYDMGARATPAGLRIHNRAIGDPVRNKRKHGKSGRSRSSRVAGPDDIRCCKDGGCKLILCHKGKCES